MPIQTVYDNGIFEGIRERPDKAYLEFKAGRRAVLSPGDEIKLRQSEAQPDMLRLRCLGARASWAESALSTSNGETQMPPTLSMSSERPAYVK